MDVSPGFDRATQACLLCPFIVSIHVHGDGNLPEDTEVSLWTNLRLASTTPTTLRESLSRAGASQLLPAASSRHTASWHGVPAVLCNARTREFRALCVPIQAGDFEFTARMKVPSYGDREVWAGGFGQNAKVRVQACTPSVLPRPPCPPMPAPAYPDSRRGTASTRDKWQNSVRGCLAAQDMQGTAHHRSQSTAGSPAVGRGSSGGYHRSAVVGARREDGAHAHQAGTRAAFALFDAGDAGAHPSWRFLHRFACAFGEAAHLAQMVLPSPPQRTGGGVAGGSVGRGNAGMSPRVGSLTSPSSRREDQFSVYEDRQSLPPPALAAYAIAMLAAVLTRNDTPLVVVRGVVDACFGLAPSWRRRHAAAAAGRRLARAEREQLQEGGGDGEEEYGDGSTGAPKAGRILRADTSFGDLAAAWEAESAIGGADDARSVSIKGGLGRGDSSGRLQARRLGSAKADGSPIDSSLASGQGRRRRLSDLRRVTRAHEPPCPQLAPFFLQPNSVFRLLRWAIGAPRARAVLQTLGVDAPSPARAGDRPELLGPAAARAREGGFDGFAGAVAGAVSLEAGVSERRSSAWVGHRTAMLLSAAHAGLMPPQDRHALRLVDPWTSWHALKLRRSLVAKRNEALRSRLLGDAPQSGDAVAVSGMDSEIPAVSGSSGTIPASSSPPPAGPGDSYPTIATLRGFAMIQSLSMGSPRDIHDGNPGGDAENTAESTFFPRMRRRNLSLRLEQLRMRQLAEAQEDEDEMPSARGSAASPGRRVSPDNVHTMLSSGQWKRYGGIRLPRSERLGSGRRLLTTDEAQEYVLISLLNKASGSRYGALAGDDEAGPQDIGGGSGVLGLKYRQVGVGDMVSSSEDEGSGSESDGGSSGLRGGGLRGAVDYEVADALPPAQGKLLARLDGNHAAGSDMAEGDTSKGIRQSPSAPSLGELASDSFRGVLNRSRSSSLGARVGLDGGHVEHARPVGGHSRRRTIGGTGTLTGASGGEQSLDLEQDGSIVYDLLLSLSKFGGPWLLSSPVLTGAVTQLQVSVQPAERTFLLQLLHSLYNPRPRDLRGWQTWRKRRLRAKKTESVAPGGRSVGRPDGGSVISGMLPAATEMPAPPEGTAGVISVRPGGSAAGDFQSPLETLDAIRGRDHDSVSCGLPDITASAEDRAVQDHSVHGLAWHLPGTSPGGAGRSDDLQHDGGRAIGVGGGDLDESETLELGGASGDAGVIQEQRGVHGPAEGTGDGPVAELATPRSPQALRGLLRPSRSPPPRSPSLTALDSIAQLAGGRQLGGSGGASGRGGPGVLAGSAAATAPRSRTPPAAHSSTSSQAVGQPPGFPALLDLAPPADIRNQAYADDAPGLNLESPSDSSRESSIDPEHDGDSITGLPTAFAGGRLGSSSGAIDGPGARVKHVKSGGSARSVGTATTGDASSAGGSGWEEEEETSDADGSDDDDYEEAEEQEEAAHEVAARHLDRFLAMWRSRVVAEVAAAITKRVRVTSLAVQYALANEAKLPESLLRTGPDSMLSLSDSDSDEEDEAVVVSPSGGLGVARDSYGSMSAPNPADVGASSGAGRSVSPAPWGEPNSSGAASGAGASGSSAASGRAGAHRYLRVRPTLRRLQRGSVSLASGLGILDADTGVVIKPASDVQVGSMRELLAFCGQAIASYRPGRAEKLNHAREVGSGVSPIPLPRTLESAQARSQEGVPKTSAFSSASRPRRPLRRTISNEPKHGAGVGPDSPAAGSPDDVSLVSPPVGRQRSSSDADAKYSPADGTKSRLAKQSGAVASQSDDRISKRLGLHPSFETPPRSGNSARRGASEIDNATALSSAYSSVSGTFSSRHFAAVGPGRLVVAVAHCLVRLGPVVCGEYSSVLRCATAAAAADSGAARYLAGIVLLRWPRNASTRQILLLRFLATTVNSWAFSHEGSTGASPAGAGIHRGSASRDARRQARMLARAGGALAGGAARRALAKGALGQGQGSPLGRSGREMDGSAGGGHAGPPSCMDEHEGALVPEVAGLRGRLVRRLCGCIQSPHAQLATAAAALCHPQPHQGEPSPLVPLILGDSTFSALVLSAFEGPALGQHWNATVRQNAETVAQAIRARARARQLEIEKEKEKARQAEEEQARAAGESRRKAKAAADAAAGWQVSSEESRGGARAGVPGHHTAAHLPGSGFVSEDSGAGKTRQRSRQSTASDTPPHVQAPRGQADEQPSLSSPAEFADSSAGSDSHVEGSTGGSEAYGGGGGLESVGSIRRASGRRHSSPALAALMG